MQRNEPGRSIPPRVREWATLYEGGLTLQRLAEDTGWRPGRAGRQPAGSFSPASIRTALLDWGVTLRKPGGRGSSGKSIMVRLAQLEQRMAELERQLAKW